MNQFLVFISDDDELEGGAAAGPSSSGQLAMGAVAGSGGGNRKEGEGESVFSKLEKTRTILETNLGLASLLEAYTLIQVIIIATFIQCTR